MQHQVSEAQEHGHNLQLLLEELELKLKTEENTHKLQMEQQERVIAELEEKVKIFFSIVIVDYYFPSLITDK